MLPDPISLPAAYLLASMAAGGVQCPAPRDYPLEYSYRYNPPPIVHTMSLKALNRDYKSHPGARDKKKISGYTAKTFKWEYSISTQPQNIPPGVSPHICFVLDRMGLNVTFSPQIFMPREYRKGGCDYQSVLNHEMRHINAMKASIEKFMPEIRKKLAAKINALLPQSHPASRTRAEVDKISKFADQYSKQLVDEMMAYDEKQQQEVDSTERKRIETGEHRRCIKMRR